jgi:hypothetical protein
MTLGHLTGSSTTTGILRGAAVASYLAKAGLRCFCDDLAVEVVDYLRRAELMHSA